MSHCVRSIKFTIPGTLTSPGVEVYVEEQNGSLVFTTTVIETGGLTGDLRGLFFDVKDGTSLAGVTHSNSGGKVTDFDTQDVIDLGNGANMNGAHAPYDVGVEFGREGLGKNSADDIKTVTFTLSNLTLDDIANVDFGVRMTSVGAIGGKRDDSSKLTTTAPAAPDAVDDSYSIFEDGQTDLNDPSKTTEGVKFEVLANDTDADGNVLKITDVEGALHGTVTIIDGDDADLLPGDAVLYTPTLDYAGTDSFTYCISDGNGGTDFAEVFVNIAAVADVPLMTYEIIPGAEVNVFTLRVTATQNDADSSEFIDRMLVSVPGGLPAGTIAPGFADPAGESDTLTQDFVITLPKDQDTSYTLNVTAWSKETSNGDEQSNTITLPIVYEYNTSTTNIEFTAEDQSIWSTGDEFVFDRNDFLGIDTGNFNEQIGSTFYAGISGHLKVGFDSNLHFEGGDIDAEAFYDVTVETNFNKTTDQLLIETGSALTDAHFLTDFAEGSYTLDFVWDIFLQAYAGINIDFGEIDLGELGTIDLGGINERLNFPAIDIGPGSLNILDVDSDSFEGTYTLPDPLQAFSINYDWPDVNAEGNYPPNPVADSDESENVVELVLDVDELIATVAGLPVNPLNPRLELDLAIATVFAELDILDIDVIGGVNVKQHFDMLMGGLSGVLRFEDGSSQVFAIGDSLQIENASLIDADGINALGIGTAGNGKVEFTFDLVPTSSLTNDTDLGFNIGYEINVLSATIGYDAGALGSDSLTIGPVATFNDNIPVGDVEIYNDTFALSFQQEQLLAAA